MCGSSCLCIGVMTLGTRASLVMTWERTNLISKGHKHEIKKGIWVESNGQPKTEECVASLIFPTRFVSATQHNTTATTQNCRQTSNCSVTKIKEQNFESVQGIQEMARAGFNNGGMVEQKGPTFFKIIKPGFNTDHLRIPPAFRKHILNELSIRATLTLSSSADSSWNVRAHKIGRDIYLKEGWQEFLRDNSLGDSEFLMFGYDGNMHFSIDIFEKNCCKRTKAPALRRHQQSTFTNNTKRPRGRPRKSGDAAEHTLNGESSNSTKRPRGRPRKSGDAAEHTLNGESRNSTKRPRGRPRKSGDAAEHTLNGESRNSTKRPRRRPRKSGDAAEHAPNGESSIPIEYTESRFPAFIRTINKVYGVDLPTGFCRKHLLPPDYYKFILENTEGDRWEVNGVPSNNTIMLSCGWVSFARGNGVEIGDDCLFELESKSKMVVHIIRQNN